MENSLKGLILGAGVVITCLVIGLGFFLSREAQNTSNNAAGQVSSMNSDYQDMNLTLYDGLKVSGSEVENLINKVDYAALSITVKTGSNDIGTTYAVKPSAFPKKGEDAYLNPTAQFLGKATRDGNNIIESITFTQQ